MNELTWLAVMPRSFLAALTNCLIEDVWLVLMDVVEDVLTDCTMSCT